LIADFESFKEVFIDDKIIYNHYGEIKNTVTGLKVIFIKILLASVEYIIKKPMFLNEFYFVFVASDGCKVVFSWNEVYNTSVGDNQFILTQNL